MNYIIECLCDGALSKQNNVYFLTDLTITELLYFLWSRFHFFKRISLTREGIQLKDFDYFAVLKELSNERHGKYDSSPDFVFAPNQGRRFKLFWPQLCTQHQCTVPVISLNHYCFSELLSEVFYCTYLFSDVALFALSSSFCCITHESHLYTLFSFLFASSNRGIKNKSLYVKFWREEALYKGESSALLYNSQRVELLQL